MGTHQLCVENGTESREREREVGEGEVGVEIGVIGRVGGREKQITEGLTGHSNYFGFLLWEICQRRI